MTIEVFLLDTASSGNIEKTKTDLLSYTGLDAVLCRENIGNSYYAKDLQDALEESIRRDYPKTGYSPEEIEEIVAEMKAKAEANKQVGTVKLDEMQGANQSN